MKLIGYVGGVEVRFDFHPPNTFKAIIPKRMDGRYIVQLRAINDSGMEDGMTSVHVYINFQSMYFKVLDDSYNFDIDDNIGYIELSEDYETLALEDNFGYNEVDSGYYHEELVVK